MGRLTFYPFNHHAVNHQDDRGVACRKCGQEIHEANTCNEKIVIVDPLMRALHILWTRGGVHSSEWDLKELGRG